MATESTLDIRGHRGLPVPHRFLRPRGAIDHLVVLLPGYGYGCDMPLFYYAENRALEVGADLLRVDYAYNRMPAFAEASEEAQRRWLLADAEAAVGAALGQRPYRGLTLVGKSLGTAAMAHLLADPDPDPGPGPGPAPALAALAPRAVWLTPMLAEPAVLAGVRRFAGPALVVIGDADPHFDAAVLADLDARPGVETLVVAGADHGLDIPGDPVASVRALGRYVEALVRFLPHGPAPNEATAPDAAAVAPSTATATPTPTPTRTDAPSPATTSAASGVSDAAVRRATGKGWDEWCALLDEWGAAEQPHPAIARHLVEAHGVDGWWAQSVTVGYERASGRRALGQHAAGFTAGVSRTFPVAADRLSAAVTDEARRDAWLEPGTLHLRTATPGRSARFDVAGGGRLAVYLTAKGPEKTTVSLQHEKLADAAVAEEWRVFWKERLARLGDALGR